MQLFFLCQRYRFPPKLNCFADSYKWVHQYYQELLVQDKFYTNYDIFSSYLRSLLVSVDQETVYVDDEFQIDRKFSHPA